MVDQNTLRCRGAGLIASDPGAASPGYTLFTPLTGTGQVYLIGLDGTVAHQWDLPYRPGRHARLLPNGNLAYNGTLPGGPVLFPMWLKYHGGALCEVSPGEFTDLPAVRPALALGLAWLFVWPFQRPWYDVMIVCLLALCPASAFDWVVMARLLAGTIVFILASDPDLGPHWLNVLFTGNSSYLAPAVRLAAVVALVGLCLPGPWRWRPRI